MEKDRHKIASLSRGKFKTGAKTDLTTVKGIVIPVEWDEKGNVMALSISTHDEDEYLVTRDAKGEELMGFMREEVEVIGLLKMEQNRKILTVKKYSPKTGLKSI
ncbi:MAG: hypothetical protein ABII26_12205 [Pseudomonadota bacterium]